MRKSALIVLAVFSLIWLLILHSVTTKNIVTVKHDKRQITVYRIAIANIKLNDKPCRECKQCRMIQYHNSRGEHIFVKHRRNNCSSNFCTFVWLERGYKLPGCEKSMFRLHESAIVLHINDLLRVGKAIQSFGLLQATRGDGILRSGITVWSPQWICVNRKRWGVNIFGGKSKNKKKKKQTHQSI